MSRITLQEFVFRQPSYPTVMSTDHYYLDIANSLLDAAGSQEEAGIHDPVLKRCALAVIGYYQDIVSDAGVWRSFVDMHRRLYDGRTLPFYETDDTYVDYELNEVDIRFIIWYVVSMSDETQRMSSPLDTRFLKLSELWHGILDDCYDEAPVPEGFAPSGELEINNPGQAEELFRLAQWLFLHCYLMTPAYSLTLSEIIADKSIIDASTSQPDPVRLQQIFEKSMMEDPTGPLALFTREWLYLLLEGRMPPGPKNEAEHSTTVEEHPLYARFVRYTGGSPICFIATYQQLNQFFIDALGWDAGEEHLPQLRDGHDFVLLANPSKGMLLANDCAKCIALPENPLYDAEYAALHAIELLTVRGRCPADLLHYIGERHALPLASFPGGDTTALVAGNFDFIARCYLQQYYRGD